MKKDIKDVRIVFMGTPEFAVPSLNELLRNCNVVAVVTAPDKPAGRGMKKNESAVKVYSKDKGLPILQPQSLKDPGFIEQLKSFNADLQIIVAFRMLPQIVWSMPPMGSVNLHASLLPQYRGAAPINWAIINGEKETGLTTFKLQHEIDTGNILLQEKIRISEEETAGELHDKMKEMGGQLLLKTVSGLVAGTLKENPQTSIEIDRNQNIRQAPKIFTETCNIDWNKPIGDVYNLVRGLSPYPGAFTTIDGKILKIYKSRKETGSPSIPLGQFETDKKSYLRFSANGGYLYVTDVQLAGKKRLPIEEFLRGYRFG